MHGVNPAPIAPFQNRMAGDAGAIPEDADLVDVVLNLDVRLRVVSGTEK